MNKNLDQYGKTVGLESNLDELVAEFAARGTCWCDSQLVGLVKYFKNVFYKTLAELPLNSNFKLKFSCSTKNECNLVYNKNNCYCILETNNNY